MPRGRTENLKPFTSQQDREAARRNGRKGGLASGRVRHERMEKRLNELAEKLLRPWDRALKLSTFSRLKWKHRNFIRAFAGCGNAAQAAREAGYSLRNAKRQGYRLLHRADIQTGLYCVNLCVYHERNPAKYPGVDLWEFESIR